VSVVTTDRPPRPKPEDVTAAEFALGLLDGEDRSRALRQLLAEPAFAADVELWQAHFGGLFETWPEVTPPIDGAARLMRAIAPFTANAADPVTVTNLPLLRWQGIDGVSSALAAGLAIVLILQPARTPRQPSPVQIAALPNLLVATIAPVKDGLPIPAIYNADTGELRIAAAALVDVQHSAELWVIAADGAPHSLGLLNAATKTTVKVHPNNRIRFVAGSTLAVTVEPIAGAPQGKPTGPVIAAGGLTLI